MGIGGSQTAAAQGSFTEEEQKKVDELQQKYSEIISKYDYFRNDAGMFQEMPQLEGDNYSAGVTNSLYRDYAEDYLNFVRSFSDLPAVTAVEEDIVLAQKGAAGLASVDRSLSHYPATDYDRPAWISPEEWVLIDKSAQQTNLSFTSGILKLAEEPIDQWLEDSGSNNKAVGHRAWILDYNLPSFGMGTAKSKSGKYFSVLRVFNDNFRIPSNLNGLITEWPSSGVFPVNHLDNGYRWSTHFSYLDYQLTDDVKVTLKNNQTDQVWSFSNEAADGEFELTNSASINQPKAGCYNTIMFNPDDITYTEDDSYTVSITGLQGAKTSYEYTVKLFELEKREALALEAFEPVEKVVTLEIGQKYTPQFIFTPEHAKTNHSSPYITNSKILNSSYQGVEAVGVGSETLTYNSSDGKFTTKITYNVVEKIVEPESLTLDSSAFTLEIDESKQLTGTVLPENATDKTIQWSSENPLIAEVSETGNVIGKALGTTVITAKTKNGKTASAEVIVKEKEIEVSEITVTPEQLTLMIGDTQQLVGTVLPENATNKEISWTSADDAIAAIAQDGTVTARAEGTTAVYATSSNGKQAAATIEVFSLEIPPTRRAIKDLFTDPNLAEAVAKYFKRTVEDYLTQAELDGMKSLTSGFYYVEIADLEGIQYFSNLEEVNLDRLKTTDISILQKLSNLKKLTLEVTGTTHNAIDLSPIKGLTKLEYLKLNQLEDISIETIGELKALKTIDIMNPRFTKSISLQPLSELPNLVTLLLSNTGSADKSLSFTDIASISELKLKTLRLTQFTEDDLGFLEKMTLVTNLNLSGCNVEQLEMLSGLTQLTSLSVSSSYNSLSSYAIQDLRALAALTNLTYLEVSSSRLQSLDGISGLKKLSNLTVFGNALTDFSIVKDLPKLTYLGINDNQIADYSTLDEFPALKGYWNKQSLTTTAKVIDGKVTLKSPFIYGDRVEMTSVVLSNGGIFADGECTWEAVPATAKQLTVTYTGKTDGKSALKVKLTVNLER